MFANLPAELREHEWFRLGPARTVLTAFSACGDAVVVIDSNRSVIAMSSEAEALYGLSNKQYEGRDLVELVGIELSVDEAENGKTITRRRDQHRNVDSRNLEVEFSMFCLDDMKVEGVRAIVVRDQTSLILALDALYKRQAESNGIPDGLGA